jgi:Fic family protein
MAKVLRRYWQSTIDSGLPRKDRRSCAYEAYIPDPLVGRPLTLDADVAADVADAERAIATLDLRAEALVDTETLARLLLRAESVASSKIEGLEVGGRRLLRAAAARDLGEQPTDITAAEVLANIDAMSWAMQSIAGAGTIALEHVLEIHRRLLTGTRLDAHAGAFRTEQNWIGGSDYNPCSAAFVPPPPELVPALLDDLVAFCNDDHLPAVAQAALAHAQFETIHPFIDGNGRTGRALIHLILRRRALAARVIVPVSLILATWSRSYVDGLTGMCYRGPARSPAAHEGSNRWIALFASACQRAVADAAAFEEQAQEIERQWREQLGSVRANSSIDLLLRALPGLPILTVNGAADRLGRSFEAANNAIQRLVDAGILRQIKVGRRNRAFEAPDVIAAFTDLERQLASPEGNTRVSPAARVVPRRRVNGASPARSKGDIWW